MFAHKPHELIFAESNCAYDVLFITDASSTVGQAGWTEVENLMIQIVQQMVNPDTRFAQVYFPDQNQASSIEFRLNSFLSNGMTDRNQVINALRRGTAGNQLNQIFSVNSVTDSFSVAANNIFACTPDQNNANCAASGDRPNVDNVAIVVLFNQFDASQFSLQVQLNALKADVTYLELLGVNSVLQPSIQPTLAGLARNARFIEMFDASALTSQATVNDVINQLSSCPINPSLLREYRHCIIHACT